MMKKYKVQVVMHYYHTVEIEASSMAEAEATAVDLFDVDKAYPGHCEIHWSTCVDDEGETK
jgi:hypothetical protein